MPVPSLAAAKRPAMTSSHDHDTDGYFPKTMFDIKSLDYLLDQAISYPSIHTAVISDTNGAVLTFVDTEDSTSEAQNRRVRIISALGIDAWRECATSDAKYDESDSSGVDAVGRAECDFGRVLTLPVHADKTVPLDPILLVTFNGTSETSWSNLQEKGYALVGRLATSLAPIGDELKGGQTPPMIKYAQPRGR